MHGTSIVEKPPTNTSVRDAVSVLRTQCW